jgi:hypothetical protein
MECINDSANLELLRRANACFSRFFERFSNAPVLGSDEELRALQQVGEILRSVSVLLDGRLQNTINRDVRRALDCYRQNLIHVRSELAIMEAAAIVCRVRLDSRRRHLYAAKAWCAASRAIS